MSFLQLCVIVVISFVGAFIVSSIPRRWYDLPLSVAVIIASLALSVCAVQWIGGAS